MAKKPQPVQLPAQQTNVLVIPPMLNVATGHQPHRTGCGYHQHKCWRRLNTRNAQQRQALKDW